MIKVFHTADVHVGLKFTRGYPEALQKALVAERIACIVRMADIANEEGCDLFVVAGDLFDYLKISKTNLKETAKALSRVEGLVVVLPGNHDYTQEVDDPIWPTFAENLGERHLVLRHKRPYDLSKWNLSATLFPGVCTSKHSKENAIGWIDAAIDADASQQVRIGIAHGSLAGLSPDFNGDYFPMTDAELEAIDVHLWLLGHTHIRYPDQETGRGDKVFYPSTPEPDGFDCHHPGYAWIIDVDENGTTAFRSVQTGSFRFQQITEANIESESDFDRLRREFDKLRSGNHLIKLKLKGRLDGGLFETLPLLLSDLKQCVKYLETDASEIVRAVRQADIDAEFTEGSFPHRLLSELATSDDDQLAMQLAYEMIREARQ